MCCETPVGEASTGAGVSKVGEDRPMGEEELVRLFQDLHHP